jgi:hypothetical protein
VLVALDVLRAATVLLLPFVDAVWQVYALIFVINACSAGFTPLFQATIPDVLPDEALIRARSPSRGSPMTCSSCWRPRWRVCCSGSCRSPHCSRSTAWPF